MDLTHAERQLKLFPKWVNDYENITSGGVNRSEHRQDSLRSNKWGNYRMRREVSSV